VRSRALGEEGTLVVPPWCCSSPKLYTDSALPSTPAQESDYERANSPSEEAGGVMVNRYKCRRPQSPGATFGKRVQDLHCRCYSLFAAALSNIAEELFQYQCLSLLAEKVLRCVCCILCRAGRGAALIDCYYQSSQTVLRSDVSARDGRTRACKYMETVRGHITLCILLPASAAVRHATLRRGCCIQL
jgi:hypothetical protein